MLGAPKAGTTTLAAWLAAHPETYLAPGKETGYFLDPGYARGPAWYAAQFAGARADQRIGEATPAYLYSEAALRRIAADAPGAVLIVLLREPVSRAWSQYWFLRVMGAEPRSFTQLVADELAGRELPDWLPAGYLDMGRYARWLQRVAELCPHHHLHVAFSEEMRADPSGVFAGVCRAIGVRDDVPPDSSREHNPTGQPRSFSLAHALVHTRARRLAGPAARRLLVWNTRPGYPAMDPGLAAELRAELASDNRGLARHLGRALPPQWS